MSDPIAREFQLDEIEVIPAIGIAGFGHAGNNRYGIFVQEEAAEVERVCAEFLAGVLWILLAPARLHLRRSEKCLVHTQEEQAAEIGSAYPLFSLAMNVHESVLVVHHHAPVQAFGE